MVSFQTDNTEHEILHLTLGPNLLGMPYVLERSLSCTRESHLTNLDTFVDFVKKEHIEKVFLPTATAFSSSHLVDEPSLMSSLAQSLRTLPVVVTRERLTLQVVRAFAHVGSNTKLINAYSASETAILATYHMVGPTADIMDVKEIPIGRPIPNLNFHILDDQMHPLQPQCT
jgi:acyl-coenzyme A synthetase/AMP-(fatty) acid ligase